MTYEWREHTAEVELAIRAATPEEVLAEAVDAFGRLVELDPGGEPATHELELTARDRGALLVALVEELIYLADTEAFVADRARIELDGDTLRAELAGRRTAVQPIVKAATFHRLEFLPADGVWQARVVLDV